MSVARRSPRFTPSFLGAGLLLCAVFAAALPSAALAEHSVARLWNEQLLEAIRNDFARPTVHARNLFHVSAAMYDAWAAYDQRASTYLHQEKASAEDVQAAREEAISYAAYRLLSWRFRNSPGAEGTQGRLDAQMAQLGFDIGFDSTAGSSPAALGNRIAETWIDYGLSDGANEQNDYANLFYEPVNPPLVIIDRGNPTLVDPNRWQPITLDVFVDQSGNVISSRTPPFLSPEWGVVTPFSLTEEDLTIYERDGDEYWVYHDPGSPPLLGGARQEEYLDTFQLVIEWSGLLDPDDGVMIDISPASRGDNTLGTNDGDGYDVNPKTGQPYEPQIVPAGDYYRVLAEFWADGPDSETPPGHWFTIANSVNDSSELVRRIGGEGPVLDELEWDVKLYFTLGGAMHDVAIAAWGAKGWYDYIRPVSAFRAMAARGQRSDPNALSYHPQGVRLVPGSVELITSETIQEGERHADLQFGPNRNIGKIAIKAWKGPNYVLDPDNDVAGVDWILAGDWWPYQRPSFVTPPFAGYVSGHSTFSRAAAELLTLFTGDPFFPGGVGIFPAPRNEFLVFEDGPSVDVELQWAKYRDASDECSLSRIYGGIHPPADDIPGRLMGSVIGPEAFELAKTFFGEPDDGPAACIASDTTICLNGGRFEVDVTWRNFEGEVGNGRLIPYSSDDSGIFWFFDDSNWELMVKVLDACVVNDHYWVFAAGTTNVEYTLRVRDTTTGELRVYENALGVSSPATTDTEAFASCP
ncbi:MAG TPA: vanadium-dependent haloperoxidase [Thermoanaerobaculia bacterium]|nr:vanadium-dependent haloperoxidase [Thermoanaerobaculia bacterium]